MYINNMVKDMAKHGKQTCKFLARQIYKKYEFGQNLYFRI